jgi:hypothetical protein
MRHTFNKPIILLGLAVAVAACGKDSPTEPAGTPPAGHYIATSFTTTGGFGQTDEIAAGSTLVLNLLPDHTTNGHLHVADNGNGQPLDADLTGTWTANGNVVTVANPTVDTFVRDMPLTSTHDPVNGWLLVGDKVFGDVRIQVTLTRSLSDPV